MRILDKKIPVNELKKMADASFGDLVKAVVDVNKQLVAVDAELHSDLEALFLEHGSQQKDLWGINFFPAMQGDDFIEFDSMINIRPSQGNMSRGVDDEAMRQKIIGIVSDWVER